ncbi:MAG: hypothetical protein ACI9FJ_002283 [Alteromonadaceae bacterium]|jgi:hypothetical protein
MTKIITITMVKMIMNKRSIATRTATQLGALLLASATITPAFADFDAGGSIRFRYEAKQDYNFAESSQTYGLTQLRLFADYKPSTTNQLMLELQDSRVFGEEKTDIPGINEDARNQPFADQLDIHRLFWLNKGDNYQLKIGRQKLNLGDKRLVASLEWVNTARVHDGIRFTYKPTKNRSIDFFASQLVSVQPGSFNDQSNSNNRYFDSGFHGVYFSDKKGLTDGQVDLWWFYRENSDFDDNIHTLGGKYLFKVGDISYDLQGAYQLGDFSDIDHSAYYLHAGLSFPIHNGKLGFAYNLGSGDDDPTDGDHKTFDNLYPLNHAYYGFMDMFSLQNVHNLEAVYQRSGWRLAWQGFWLNDTNDAWYNAGLKGNGSRLQASRQNSSVSRYVGSEIDLTYKKAFMDKKLMLMVGVSQFFTGGYIEDTGGDDDDATFFFLQTKYSF